MLAVSRSGPLFVLDGSDNQIRRCDPRGRFQGIMGRAGSGPGEYRQVVGMALHGDSVRLVYDPPNDRITIFDPTGAYRRGIRLGRGAFFGDKDFALDAPPKTRGARR